MSLPSSVLRVVKTLSGDQDLPRAPVPCDWGFFLGGGLYYTLVGVRTQDYALAQSGVCKQCIESKKQAWSRCFASRQLLTTGGHELHCTGL